MQDSSEIQIENLVIGSGVAGLMLALKLARSGKVLIVTKGRIHDSSSYFAQGGIASVLSDEDSFDQHMQDTRAAGAGLCHEEIVKLIIQQGPQSIEELAGLGVKFTKEINKDGEGFHLTKEGGHSHRRVVHSKDTTGKAIMTELAQRVGEHQNIRLLESHAAIDLITTDKYKPSFSRNTCVGAYVLGLKTGQITTIRSHRTFLATGGHGRLYLYTSNPPQATGDGLAMAWRAGCKVTNLEFMQFHPTCLFHPQERHFLISEAVRGEGGILRNSQGIDFMKAYHPLADLAPRDIVARAIDSELKRSGEDKVFLDVRHLGQDRIAHLFPHIFQKCLSLGMDISKEMIPVVPAAHYSCGGVIIDQWGQTGVENLYAVGEVACSGLHGANRLASNSLLEACVLADRAAQHAVKQVHPITDLVIPAWDKGKAIPADEQVILSHTWDEIRRIMWHYVGIVRSDARLRRALSKITSIQQELDTYYWQYEITPNLLEVRNLALVALLTVRCAMTRKESRGIHYNIDHPNVSSYPPKDTVLWG